MKKYLLLGFLFLSITVLAQNTGGPGPYGYTWFNSDHASVPAVYNWINIGNNSKKSNKKFRKRIR